MSGDALAKIGDLAAEAGLERIHVLAWRDLADPEAGGSELHIANIASRWAEAGIQVTMRTSYAPGASTESMRDGYRVIRRAGRYMVFPRAALSETIGRHGERDGLVEIWNGVPFFTPLWARGPRMVFLHHLHEHMWPLVLPPFAARVGSIVERRVAPAVYNRTRIVTLSESSRQNLVARAGFDPSYLTVVPPGVDARFSPAGDRTPYPSVVSVGRLMTSKYFEKLVDAVAVARQDVANLELTIVGEGAERDRLAARVASLDAHDWVHLRGRCSDEELVALYRRSWLVASASMSEGWGMTLTEAAACGTPAVATRIPGHIDAVADGTSGVLVDSHDDLAGALAAVLNDRARLERLRSGALDHARRFTWDQTAHDTLAVLAADARRKRRQ